MSAGVFYKRTTARRNDADTLTSNDLRLLLQNRYGTTRHTLLRLCFMPHFVQCDLPRNKSEGEGSTLSLDRCGLHAALGEIAHSISAMSIDDRTTGCGSALQVVSAAFFGVG